MSKLCTCACHREGLTKPLEYVACCKFCGIEYINSKGEFDEKLYYKNIRMTTLPDSTLPKRKYIPRQKLS